MLEKAQSEIFIERGAISSGTKTAGKIRQLKKLVARILTIITEKKSEIPKEVKHK